MPAPRHLSLGGDLEVFRLGFGGDAHHRPGSVGRARQSAGIRALLRHVVERDVNLIDTADSYGPEVSENLIAEALRPYPENLVIATKGGFERPGPDAGSRTAGPTGCSAVLRGFVEAAQGRADRPLPAAHGRPEGADRGLGGALAELQDEGKIRHIGVSNVTVEEIERAQQIVQIVSVQNHYNV